MFRSARTIEAEAVDKKLTRLREQWQRTADTWFDGTVESVDRRIANLDQVITFAKRAQAGDGPSASVAFTGLPTMLASREQLATMRMRMTGGAWEDEFGPGLADPRWQALHDHFEDPRDERAHWNGPDGPGRGFVAPGGDNGFADFPPEGMAVHRDRATGRERILDQNGVDRFGGLIEAARDFIAEQGTEDRAELLIRARRMIEDKTWDWSRTASYDAVRAFCGAVDAEIPRQVRTAAAPRHQFVADFADELMFG